MRKEYKVTVYYTDKNNEQKIVVHKLWTWHEENTSEIAKTHEILERSYNKDVCKIVGVSVQRIG